MDPVREQENVVMPDRDTVAPVWEHSRSYNHRVFSDDITTRLGPRVKKIKNGYLESSKDCYSINLKKYTWCIRNHCIASFSELNNVTRANKIW